MLIMHVIIHLGIIIINYAALDFLLFAFALRMHSIFMPLMHPSERRYSFMKYYPTPDVSDFAEKEDAGVAG